MSEAPSIHERMSAVMAEIGAIAKAQTNTFDKYKFRGIDDVYNAMHPALCKHEVYVVPRLVSVERTEFQTAKGATQQVATVNVEFAFYAPDGSSVVARAPGEGADRGDKAINKAMSAAYKTAMFQTFCIPTEHSIDSEQDSPDLGSRRPAPPQQSTQAPPAQPAPGPTYTPPAGGGEFYFGADDPQPPAPSWSKWRDDEIKSGKMKGRTWNEICGGSFKGQRYQYAVSLATFEPDNPEKFEQTRLRALNAVWQIERNARLDADAEGGNF